MSGTRKRETLPEDTAMFDSSIAQASVRRLILAAICLLCVACGKKQEDPVPSPDQPLAYVGSAACGGCHEQAFDAWRDSHHALAMQLATPATVLGDFSGREVRILGTTSRFFVRDDSYYVLTDNAAGVPQEYPVRYTFGVEPLQQYLVEFAGGRLQTLPFAWDARATDEGGQRWFHVYPDESIAHEDPLHWTGREQNWNYMCAECHSTDVDKNYSADSDAYSTTWSEINVGCEGCHGPGSAHVAEAAAGAFTNRAGLVTDLDDNPRAVWQMNPATGIAARSELRMRPPAQPEACGRCHARRSVITAAYEYGKPLLDTHLPALLEEPLYFADGQIREEVYVYGSFLQSRMYQAGVSCSDCHEPHAATLHTGSTPSDVCTTCHLPSRFDITEHHRHPRASVACVDCHMPSRDYMVIDGRRDHSFRIPRPDLTIATGSPNACNQCHVERDAEWSVAAFEDWYGGQEDDHYGFAIHAGRTGGGNQPLLEAIANTDYPGIVRGTALTLLRAPYAQEVGRVIERQLQSGDPFVRLGALRALAGLPQDLQADLAAPLLGDRLRAIRIAAARVVSPARGLLHVRFDDAFRRAEQDLVASQEAIAERPEAHMNLGNFYAQAGDAARGEAEFLKALRLEPRAIGARVNLADLYRQLNRETDAEALLREGLQLTPEDASLHHSLGLLLVRTGRQQDGLASLGEAMALQPDNARYLYVYAVALNSLGQSEVAIDLLRRARDRFPADFDIHWATATMLRDQGRSDEARAVAEALADVYPGIPSLQDLIRSL